MKTLTTKLTHLNSTLLILETRPGVCNIHGTIHCSSFLVKALGNDVRRHILLSPCCGRL